MPKFSIKIDNLRTEDSIEVSDKFSSLNNFLTVGGQLPEGFVINYKASNSFLEKALWELTNLIGPKSLSSLTDTDLNALRRKTTTSKLPAIQDELNESIKKLKLPIYIKALVKLPDNKQVVSYEALINKKDGFPSALNDAYFSFLTHNIISTLKQTEDLAKIQISILVLQKTIAEVSGKASVDENSISIYSQWGEINEYEKFDEVELSLKDLELQKYVLNLQEKQLIIDKGKYKIIPVSKKYQRERKMELLTCIEIGRILKKLKVRFLGGIEVYFEIVNNKLIFTDINFDPKPNTKELNEQPFPINLPLLSKLTPLIPGIVSGLSRTITKTSDIKKLRHGDIAVIESFKKEYLPILKRASGIVITSANNFQKEHLTKLREVGLTSAIGKISVTAGQVITLDGKSGKVYRGAFSPFINKTILPIVKEVMEVVNPKSATKIFVYGDNEIKTKDFKPEEIDGFGPITPERFLLKSGIHPKHLVTNAQQKTLTQGLNSYLLDLNEKLAGKPLIYQLSDFKTDQLINLASGLDYETAERNPLIGKRGAQRALENPELVKLELSIIKNLRNKESLHNIWLSLPFVRTLSELYSLKKLISAEGLDRSPTFKLLLTANVPANIFLLEDIINMGIDGIIIDYYDLACLTFGKSFSFDELKALEDPALEELIEIALITTRKKKIFSAIVGIPLESESDILKKCVSLGVTAVSVNRNQVEVVRKILAKEEKELVVKENA